MPVQGKYHPNILLDPSSYDSIYSTMSFFKQHIKQKRVSYTSRTFYLPLLWKASEMKAAKSLEFDCIHLKLGGFHQLMYFIDGGSKLMQNSRLKEVRSTVYKKTFIRKC